MQCVNVNQLTFEFDDISDVPCTFPVNAMYRVQKSSLKKTIQVKLKFIDFNF